jgi:hypothetical protein
LSTGREREYGRERSTGEAEKSAREKVGDGIKIRKKKN